MFLRRECLHVKRFIPWISFIIFVMCKALLSYQVKCVGDLSSTSIFYDRTAILVGRVGPTDRVTNSVVYALHSYIGLSCCEVRLGIFENAGLTSLGSTVSNTLTVLSLFTGHVVYHIYANMSNFKMFRVPVAYTLFVNLIL